MTSFLLIFFRPSDPQTEKSSRKSTNKNSGLIYVYHKGLYLPSLRSIRTRWTLYVFSRIYMETYSLK